MECQQINQSDMQIKSYLTRNCNLLKKVFILSATLVLSLFHENALIYGYDISAF